MRKIINPFLILFLAVSILCNFYLLNRISNSPLAYTFTKRNTEQTYESLHNITAAQKIATGKGIKVGVIDKYFGLNNHPNLYAGGIDFTNKTENLNNIEEHGYWMATTLREIAPNAEIYALNARTSSKQKTAQAISEAINWAIENDIDILTYSAEKFTNEQNEILAPAIQKAAEKNIIFTFIHNDFEQNILPCTFYDNESDFERAPDIKIFHKDYNTLNTVIYNRYINSGKNPSSGNDTPYFSVSSMSPVLAGTVAMMKEVAPKLSVNEIKYALKESGKTIEFEKREINNVLNSYSAVSFVKDHNNMND